MLKKLLKKIKCRLFFCFGSKCSYNEHGKGKLNVEFNEENILSNFKDEIDKVSEIEDWSEKIPSNIQEA